MSSGFFMELRVSYLEVSIIIPAYNEEKRMVPFIKRMSDFSKKYPVEHEVIFIDDGSTDRTLEVIKNLKWNKLRIISYKPNQGKGFAVKKGVENSKGDKIIFIDADDSISPDEIPEMVKQLNNYDVVVGTRYYDRKKVKQPLHRLFTGTMFNLYVNFLFRINIHDNLCGFKGFKKQVADELFKNLISNRWVFDVELFYKIRKYKFKLYEMTIHWVHREDSKIKFIDILKMVINLLKLRMKV